MGFKKIFWGLVLMFNFYLGRLNIMPSFIGYILIYKGLSRIIFLSDSFAIAKKASLILVFLSLPNIVSSQGAVAATWITLFPSASYIGYIMNAITSITQIVFYIYLYKGIIEVANKEQHFEIYSRAKFLMSLYKFSIAINILVIVLGYQSFLTIVAIALGVINYILSLLLVSKCNNDLTLNTEY